MEKGQHPDGECSDAEKLFPGEEWVMHVADKSSQGWRSGSMVCHERPLVPGFDWPGVEGSARKGMN